MNLREKSVSKHDFIIRSSWRKSKEQIYGENQLLNLMR
jgi:hypothetical protein